MDNKKNFLQNSFSEDYEELVSQFGNEGSVVVNVEWNQDGDNFKKFSIYDNNYSPVIISSSTTLINSL